jgi:DNA-binding beta-propeller fold protein YncE
MEDMCSECVKPMAKEELPSSPNWGGKVEDLIVITERETGRLLFVDSSNHRVVKEIEAGYAIHAPTFTPNSVSDRWLWAISRNGWLLKIDLYSLQVVGKIRVGLDSRGTAVSTDGRYVIVGNYIPNNAVIIDAETLKPLKLIEASGLNPAGDMVKSRVAAVLSTPVGPYFEFALKEAGQVWVVDYSKADFPVVAKISNVGGILHDGFLTPDGRYLQVASQADGAMVVIDLKEMSIVKKIPAGKQPHPGPGAVFLSQGRLLAATVAIGEGMVTVWDTRTWEVVKTLPTPGPGLFIRSHPESRYVWVDCSADSSAWDNILVFDRETLSVVATLQPGRRAIHPEFTPDGKFVYVGCWNDNKVIVYDALTLEKVAEFAATTPTGIFSAGVRQEEPGA